MLQNCLLKQLSAFNTRQLQKEVLTRSVVQSLKFERKLVRFVAKNRLEKLKPVTDDTLFWEQVAILSENYRRLHWLNRGRVLNLNSPTTLSEKLEWLKYNDHRSALIQLCDKLAVRDYVVDKTGDNTLLSQLFGVYEKVNDINFVDLPEKFVVKIR